MSNEITSPKRFSLSKLNKATQASTVSIEIDGDTLELSYNRSKYTPQFEKEMDELKKQELVGSMLGEMVYALITDWNVYEVVDETKPESEWEWYKVPLTKETFSNLLSIDALVTLMQTISEDNRPN